MRQKPNYGIDSPAIIGFQVAISLVAFAVVVVRRHSFGSVSMWIALACGVYFLHGGVQMLYYSKSQKLKLRERILDLIDWRGDESVLDVGCGRGLLLVGAARRLTTGKAVGLDVWLPHAISGNGSESALGNASVEGVADRVEVQKGDVRELPFEDALFDVAVSNFVLHEVQSRQDREKMLREIIRVLKPGGRLALVDFIFTKECVAILKDAGATDATRVRGGGVHFWISALLTFGFFQLYTVTATRDNIDS